MQPYKQLSATGLALALSLSMAAMPAAAQNVTVLVNGQTMTFDQPPVMRNGRVFVPMRAIFERLGSSVVFSNGVINAQGNGRSVHLTIGSTQAQVNNQPYTMDVAPFTIAGRTLVPLRFVAQSLGANVNWNSGNSTVAITAAGAPQNVTYTPQPSSNITLSAEQPARGATVNSTHPAIHAGFSAPVNRDSLHVDVDGRDVTNLVYANPNGFNVTPNWELAPGTHSVHVTGNTQSGAAFSQSWSFDTTAGAAPNFINGLTPTPGAKVGGQFTLAGRTIPGSKVHIVASGAANAFGGLLQVDTGTFQTDVTADGNGHFTAPIAINAVSGGQVRVIVTSTSPAGASIERPITFSS
jgi:hypothetical protein